RLVVDGTQDIGCGTDVGDRQMLVDLGDAVVSLRLEPFQRVGIFIGLADRLLKDRRVRGDALQPVALDERAQLALRDQAALEIIKPRRLATRLELLQLVHGAFSLAGCRFVASNALSALKSNVLIARVVTFAEATQSVIKATPRQTVTVAAGSGPTIDGD